MFLLIPILQNFLIKGEIWPKLDFLWAQFNGIVLYNTSQVDLFRADQLHSNGRLAQLIRGNFADGEKVL